MRRDNTVLCPGGVGVVVGGGGGGGCVCGVVWCGVVCCVCVCVHTTQQLIVNKIITFVAQFSLFILKLVWIILLALFKEKQRKVLDILWEIFLYGGYKLTEMDKK